MHAVSEPPATPRTDVAGRPGPAHEPPTWRQGIAAFLQEHRNLRQTETETETEAEAETERQRETGTETRLRQY